MKTIPEMEQTVNEIVGNAELSRKIVFALLRRFGGDRIYIPTGENIERNATIRELFASGVSATQLAQRFRLSCATIYRIVK